MCCRSSFGSALKQMPAACGFCGLWMGLVVLGAISGLPGC